VLAQYVHIGADEERQQLPRVPSRESYLALLNAFEAVYMHRAEPASRHTWTYFSNLEGLLATETASVTDPEQRHQTVVMQIARRRAVLESTNDWDTPGNVGHCFWTAVLEEGVDSTILDQLLAPYWPVLWRLAARGHWIRHAHRPTRSGEIRRSGPLIPPRPLSVGELTLSFRSAPGGDLIVTIASRSRGFGMEIARYPELMEFRVLVETTEDRWVGRYYAMTVEAQPPGVRRVQLRRRRMYLEFSTPEWLAVRDLVRRAWEIPYMQHCLAELQQEYGEHG